jgi:hypothetical protein
MAKVKIQGHASGTGILTVTAPNTSTDRTITLPDATGTLATTDDTTDLDGAITINESGADVDFRVESNGDANALFLHGGDGFLGMGTATPKKMLHILEPGSDNVIILDTNNTETDQQICFAHHYGAGNETGGKYWGIGIDGSENDFVIAYDANSQASLGGDRKFTITDDGRGLSQFTAKAWCNFDGTGTVAFRDSHNCSSLTDNAAGNYTVAFTNNMANANYSVSASSHGSYTTASITPVAGAYDYAVGTVRVVTRAHTALADNNTICISIFGD